MSRLRQEYLQQLAALIGGVRMEQVDTREIQIATDTAVKDLYDLSGKLATDIASRIIRKELNAAEHERLISERR